MMPRYLTSFTASTSLAGLFHMEKHMETVFLTIRVKWGNSSHLQIFCNACVRCSLAKLAVVVDSWTTVSLAYIWQLTPGQQFGRSFMYIANNSGPSTAPCGTPMLLAFRGYFTPLTLTPWLSLAQDLNHCKAYDDILNWFNLFSQILGLTVSKAYRNTTPTTFLFIQWGFYFFKQIAAVSVEFLSLNPNCWG